MKLKIDGETQIFGLLGSGIGYTKSPVMHNRAAEVLGKNIVYLPLQLEADRVLPFLETAFHMNFGGFNVTQPHKELVARALAASSKSVNTIIRAQDGWQCASTDGIGFANSLGRIGRELCSFERIVFIGSGGAVLAILEHIVATQKDLPTVDVCRRSRKNDASLKDAYAGSISFYDLSVDYLQGCLHGYGNETLLIQASSAPIHGDDLQAIVPALSGFSGVVCDLVYSTPSKVYFAALNANLSAMDGEPMLIEQARASQKLWWGKSASYEDMLLALRGK